MAKGKVFDMEEYMNEVGRIVIKISSRLVVDKKGFRENQFKHFADEIAYINRDFDDILVVTGGAVGAGQNQFPDYVSLHRKLPQERRKYGWKQAFATLGQPDLIDKYKEALRPYGLKAAQWLLDAKDLNDPEGFDNLWTTYLALRILGVIPIINANDLKSVKELGPCSENDGVAAEVSIKLQDKELLEYSKDFKDSGEFGGSYDPKPEKPRKTLAIMMSEHQLYDCNPADNPDARPIYVVQCPVPEYIKKGAGKGPGSGGEETKVYHAGRMAENGIAVVFVPGDYEKNERILVPIVRDCQLNGTLFLPKGYDSIDVERYYQRSLLTTPMSALRKRYIIVPMEKARRTLKLPL